MIKIKNYSGMRINYKVLCFLFYIFFAFSYEESIGQPQPKRIIHIANIRDNSFDDPYYWMKEKNEKDVTTYLKEENEYGKMHINKDSLLIKKIYSEIQEKWYEPAVLHRSSAGENDLITNQKYNFKWKKVKSQSALISSKNDTVIDLNKFIGKNSYFDTHIILSSDKKYLALLLDTIGNEEFSLLIFDLYTLKQIPTNIKGVVNSLVWADDNKSILYVRPNPITKRWEKIYRHNILEQALPDSIFYFENDLETQIYLSSTLNGEILINAQGSGKFEQYIVLNNRIISICESIKGIENHIKFYEKEAFVLTNYLHPNFSIVCLSKNYEKINTAKIVLAASDSMVIRDFHIRKNYIIIEMVNGATTSLFVYNIKTKIKYKIPADSPVADYMIDDESDDFSDTLIYTYLPANRPYEYCYFNLKTKQQKTEKPIYLFPDSLNENTLKSEVIYAIGSDNKKIPISLVYLSSTKLDGKCILELEAYGAYGTNKQAGFSFLNWPFLKRGGIVAYAHVRGGGEYGAKWHQETMSSKKIIAVKDLLCCANYLVQKRYSSEGKICIKGGSAGAVTVAQTVNFNPNLFGCMILRVPFLDVISTMSDSLIPGVVTEYDEWGNPWNQNDYNEMKLYDPYRNIKPNNYPSMLIRSSYNDSRVMYWEAAKYAASIRYNNQKSKSTILLLTNFESGHQNKKFKIEAAENYSFIFQSLK